MFFVEGVFTVEVGQDTHHTTSVPVICHTTSVVDVASSVRQHLKHSNYIFSFIVNNNALVVHCKDSMSPVARKTVFKHKPGSTAIEGGQRLEISD